MSTPITASSRDCVCWPVPGAPESSWHARSFGDVAGDLALDLYAPPPWATTDVLTHCLTLNGNAPSAEAVWAWTVNRRLQGLLAVAAATRGDAFVRTERCGQADCDELMDLPLSLTGFQRVEDPHRFHVDVAGGQVELRLPTGADQRAWLKMEPSRLYDCLLVGADTLPDEALQPIDDALANADPMTALELTTRCPSCERETRLPIDLEQVCLEFLRTAQARLIDDVHTLALTYHWSEDAIVALPAARRHAYLARIIGGAV